MITLGTKVVYRDADKNEFAARVGIEDRKNHAVVLEFKDNCYPSHSASIDDLREAAAEEWDKGQRLYQLMPCPFCKGRAVFQDYSDHDSKYQSWVECEKCSARGPKTFNLAPGVIAWNNQWLYKKVHSPLTAEWIEAVKHEAEYQQQRWGSEHDEGKTTAEWFWLVGHLASKALMAFTQQDKHKGLHHIISTSAALLNWHRNITGERTEMRVGIATPAEAQEKD